MSPPRSSVAAMDDEQTWMRRLHQHLDWLRTSGRGAEATQAQHRSILQRWIRFALAEDWNPSSFEEYVVTDFLDQQDNLGDGTRATYLRTINRWFDWIAEATSEDASDVGNRNLWAQRLEEYVIYLRDERGVGESTYGQRSSIARRWIEFALQRGHSPAKFDDGLVGELLDRQRDLADSSRYAYTKDLENWCRWASGEQATNRRTSADESAGRDEIATWMARLEEYLSYLRHRERKPNTIKNRRRHVSKWIRFACSTGRNPAVWDPSAVEEAFVVWGTVESARQRKYISRRIEVWCQYWEGTDLNSPALEEFVRQFRGAAYPDEETPHHLAARAEFERVLQSLPDLSYERRAELRTVWKKATYDYGGPGVTAAIDAAIRDVSETDWPPMRDRIHALCYGDDDVAVRFDETTASIKGLGELMATRLLAITQPQRFLPNFIARSSSSKVAGQTRCDRTAGSA